VSLKVSGRLDIKNNDFDRFSRKIQNASERTVEQALNAAAMHAKAKAPKDTGKLAQSIKVEKTGRTSGKWGSDVDYAKTQEVGSHPHPISGNMKFFWSREGRWFGRPFPNMVRHPGNKGKHYLKDSFDYMTKNFMSIARRNFPR
jgi:hypothetical protein